MKSLKLPKNKYLRLLINIIFVIVWYLIASQIKWQLNGLRFFPYIYPLEVGCDPLKVSIKKVSLYPHWLTSMTM